MNGTICVRAQSVTMNRSGQWRSCPSALEHQLQQTQHVSCLPLPSSSRSRFYLCQACLQHTHICLKTIMKEGDQLKTLPHTRKHNQVSSCLNDCSLTTVLCGDRRNGFHCLHSCGTFQARHNHIGGCDEWQVSEWLSNKRAFHSGVWCTIRRVYHA